ncbi:class I SAM-dependent methyltransferase [Streptomyces sp. NPDC001020]
MTSSALYETSTPEFWDAEHRKDGVFREVTSFERRMFRAFVSPVSGWRAVNVGCGRGTLAACMAVWGLDVTGFDLSSVAITDARRIHAGVEHLAFVEHDFNTGIHPALQPGSVDLVACRLTLEFLERERFLVDVRRWLKPTGVLHVTTRVREKTPPSARFRGLPENIVEGLGDGFRTMNRYRLCHDGSVTCVVLRGPQP